MVVMSPYHSPASHDVTWAIGSFHNDCKERYMTSHYFNEIIITSSH